MESWAKGKALGVSGIYCFNFVIIGTLVSKMPPTSTTSTYTSTSTTTTTTATTAISSAPTTYGIILTTTTAVVFSTLISMAGCDIGFFM